MVPLFQKFTARSLQARRNSPEYNNVNTLSVKSKAVPLLAMEAYGGREGIAPTHT
jgi:hypothetical protein